MQKFKENKYLVFLKITDTFAASLAKNTLTQCQRKILNKKV